VRRSLFDRLSVGDDSGLTSRFMFLGLVWLGAAWVWLVVTHPLAGVVLVALGFVLLVAAIALNNWLEER
jgi:hypothetical protein